MFPGLLVFIIGAVLALVALAHLVYAAADYLMELDGQPEVKRPAVLLAAGLAFMVKGCLLAELLT